MGGVSIEIVTLKLLQHTRRTIRMNKSGSTPCLLDFSEYGGDRAEFELGCEPKSLDKRSFLDYLVCQLYFMIKTRDPDGKASLRTVLGGDSNEE